MSQSVLMDHGARGAREVHKAELVDIEAPPSTLTWFPIRHADVLFRVEETLDAAGFRVERERLLVSHNEQRFFGVLDLKSQVADGVSLSVGIRNSNDQSFPIGFACGSKVFVCSNLSFNSEVVISRRHTKYGKDRYQEALSLAIQGLHQFQIAENERISRLQQWELSEKDASHLLLKSFEVGILSSRTLPAVIQEWREPSYEEFRPRNAWSLLNACTHVLKDRQTSNPQQAALTTMKLHRLLQPEAN